jgi:hypothetical protein
VHYSENFAAELSIHSSGCSRKIRFFRLVRRGFSGPGVWAHCTFKSGDGQRTAPSRPAGQRHVVGVQHPTPPPSAKRATRAAISTERRASSYRCTHAPSNKLPRRRGSSAAAHSESARLGRPRRSDARGENGRDWVRRRKGRRRRGRGPWCGRRGTAEGTCRRPAPEGTRRDLGQLGFVVGQRFSGSAAWNRERMRSWCRGGGRRRGSSPDPVSDGGGANGVVRRERDVVSVRWGGPKFRLIIFGPKFRKRNFGPQNKFSVAGLSNFVWRLFY